MERKEDTPVRKTRRKCESPNWSLWLRNNSMQRILIRK